MQRHACQFFRGVCEGDGEENLDVPVAEDGGGARPVFGAVKFDAERGAGLEFDEEVDAVVCVVEGGEGELGEEERARGRESAEGVDDCAFLLSTRATSRKSRSQYYEDGYILHGE